jgi:UDP-GlcNAc:undecaprenyl-phosphate/decaprenyl-phosphate GlcNAc-1-phosphate transferase
MISAEYAVTFMVAFLISCALTPLVKKFAFRANIIAAPSPRKMHKVPMPQAGGLAVYSGFILSLLIVFSFGIMNRNFLMTRDWTQLLGLFVGGTFILILGVIDDKYALPAKVKLCGQIIAAIILILFGIKIEFLCQPFNEMFYLATWPSIILTIIWVVGLTNALNLIDGLDGLLAGVTSIACFVLFIIAMQKSQFLVAIMLLSLMGSCCGFLRYNFNPARIFMGDTGSLFLGYMLAAFSIVGALKTTATLALGVPILVFALPIFDTLSAIVRRFIKGRPIFQPDKEHVHHQLMKLGLNQKQAVLFIYLISGFMGVAALALNYVAR